MKETGLGDYFGGFAAGFPLLEAVAADSSESFVTFFAAVFLSDDEAVLSARSATLAAFTGSSGMSGFLPGRGRVCLLYTSDAADE